MKHISMTFGVSAATLLICLASLSSCSKSTSGDTIEGLAPESGTNAPILRERVLNYIKAMKEVAPKNDFVFNDQAGKGVSVLDYIDKGHYYQGEQNIKLSWYRNTNVSEYKVLVGFKEDLTDAKEYLVKEPSLTLTNPYAAKTYFWQVDSKDGKYKSDISSFTTDAYSRMIEAGGVWNIRDIGGHPTIDGKHVKQGIIYRGSELVDQQYVHNGSTHVVTLTAEGKRVLTEELGVNVEIDFRGDEEANNITSSALGYDVEYVRKPIAAYDYCVGKHSNGTPYPEMVQYYSDIFELLRNANRKHVYFHCWGGADRTGTIGFLINALLGVSYTDLIIDYELTSFDTVIRVREDNGDWKFTTMIETLKERYQKNDDDTIQDIAKNWARECLGWSDIEINALIGNLTE